MSAPQKSNPDSQAIPSDLKPEQALGLVGLGMMQRISSNSTSRLRLVEDNQEKFDLHALRERLELIALAIETGAPLSTAEVTHLIGARPGSSKTTRGGLLARRISRNVWKLSGTQGEDSSYWRN
ncbi:MULTISPECIES: hypothetical protein [Prochlorococcus]|uniref:Uncharacterized protein n=1 Tax=Prochlorococcus marinus (strain SARG / CCMP1375 / SS120) TaxID=167539 RepID=Q7VD36_PROMA|nr:MULTISPECIES: hypothetical protein [Prochlorococcus]AAP99592.1 Uncharacterized protein Pro_0547 [Prochlorococcus marinus subsp. marinus str. CCMP1375]KGG11138.1 hypothetical protein EV04_1211 [Prochlorococcus marinus str. LG]KGG21476.1 hypothetical protein EV08_0561 [Prochlorococcus marinus str. SS2]KGG23179.1 hypothetical protein EV09_1927 [Prochlorococcus marinus str. SS35]KGG33890.1 hypothetical protein EV10_0329 [Prochlorococcus marinus str. SS51]